MSDTLNILYVNFDALEPDEVFPKAAGLLDKALALDTEDADIYASLGLLKNSRWNAMQQPVDLDQSDAAFERAIALNPNHAQAVAWYAASKLDTSEYAEAIKLFERSLELDPLARITQTNLAQSYAGTRRISQSARPVARKRADESRLADGARIHRPASRGPWPAR